MAEKRAEVVVITGASAGVGRAVVREFARHGAHIGLIAHGKAGLEGAKRDVEAACGKRPYSSGLWMRPVSISSKVHASG